MKATSKKPMGADTAGTINEDKRFWLSRGGFSSEPSDDDVRAMSMSLAEDCGPIVALAMSGNRTAIKAVVDLASYLAKQTEILACEHQAEANAVARERSSWPLLVDPHPEVMEHALRFIKGPTRLPLGEATPWKAGAKAVSMSGPSNGTVARALGVISFHRLLVRQKGKRTDPSWPEWMSAAHFLPELTRETKALWFDVIWLWVLNLTNSRPERDKTLRQLGLSEANAKGNPHTKPKSYESHVRSGIKKALKRSLDRMLK